MLEGRLVPIGRKQPGNGQRILAGPDRVPYSGTAWVKPAARTAAVEAVSWSPNG